MKLAVEQSNLHGAIEIPSSKSHTIRALVIAGLANGKSVIKRPLKSADTLACVDACKQLGAKIEVNEDIIVEGFNGKPLTPSEIVDVKNSGTTLRLVAGIAAHCDGEVKLDGDESIKTRPMQPLLTALNNLGAEALSLNNNGKCPISIKGKLKGGKTEVNGISSQYVSSLLISCPLAEEDTDIIVNNLHERPYVEMTLKWLEKQSIQIERENLTRFKIKGNQSYKAFEEVIPADWSSAAFPICAALITQSDILLKGLDINDTQGDKAIIDILKSMGAKIEINSDGIEVKASRLQGKDIDLNSTPDALPALSVVGCFAAGQTVLKNVAQARLKETDRIKVMAKELKKMGADIEELSDGLVIRESVLKGRKLSGHNDHRIVMALSIAGLASEGKTEITTAESIDVTFPNYAEKMNALGAKIELTK